MSAPKGAVGPFRGAHFGSGRRPMRAGRRAVVVLRREVDVAWLPGPNEVLLATHGALPNPAATTAAFVFAFLGKRLLLVDVVRRGWEIPGGHVEPGEAPAQAARREVFEEAGARLGPLRLLACQRHRVLAPRPSDYRLPYPDSYMAFYVARITRLAHVAPDGEIAGRELLALSRAAGRPWVQRHRALHAAAVRLTQAVHGTVGPGATGGRRQGKRGGR